MLLKMNDEWKFDIIFLIIEKEKYYHILKIFSKEKCKPFNN